MNKQTIKEQKLGKPFGLSWLDSSYLEALLPGTPWQSVNDFLCPMLAEIVKQQFHNEHRRQMIIELMGSIFKRSYLSDDRDDPKILETTSLDEDQFKKLENEAKSWLQIQINEIALSKQFAITQNQSEKDFRPEMKDFLEHLYQIITTSMDRHLFLKLSKTNKVVTNSNSDHDIDIKAQPRSIQRYSARNNLKLVLQNKKHHMPPIQEKSRQFVGELSSEYSELISDSLLYILRKDPRRTSFLLHKLCGQQLTNSLRYFIWSDILLRNERKKDNLPLDIEIIARKNFASGVLRGKNELKLKDPTVSPVSGLIETSVVETYSKVAALNCWIEEQHLKQTMKVLNILYTYSKDYEPYFIYWLLPFQITFKNDSHKTELIYDLAMYLDLYIKNCFPNWTEVFTVASKVCADLSRADNEFYEHLMKIAKKNAKVNQKDFVNEIIYNEGKKAGNYPMEKDKIFQKINKDMLSEPVIFFRKWIGEGFAGVLNPNALLYVWDQLYMSLWSSKQLENITKIILYLLRDKFMKASDYDQMRRVFLNEPCRIYTLDIQKAFVHLINGGNEEDINRIKILNRENSIADSENDNDDENYTKYISLNDTKPNNIDTLGIRYLHMTLIVSKQGVSSELDPTRLIVVTTLFYGEIEIAQRTLENIGVIMDIKSSVNETKLYEIGLATETIQFDISAFLNEISLKTNSKEIYLVIVVKYQTITYHQIDLGFAKISIYKPDPKDPTINTQINQGKLTRMLHSGSPQNDLSDISDMPKNSYKDRIGPNSFITFNIINPQAKDSLHRQVTKIRN